MFRLFVLFTVVPAVELYLLLKIGQIIGAIETMLVIILTGIVGSYMAKREGLSVFAQIRSDAAEGVPPTDGLIEGFLVFIGGVLLITPGVLTDFFGFALIAPWSRRALAPWLRRSVMKRVNIAGMGMGVSFADNKSEFSSSTSGSDGSRSTEHFDHPIR